MASFFAHGLVAVTFSKLSRFKKDNLKIGFFAFLCSTFPDADVIMFRFGISYNHWLGHRGFIHSICFAFIFAVLVKLFAFRKTSFFSPRGILLVLFFTLVMASHGVIDAMTTGGRGVAFFAPFDNTRYFLPWRVIKVSPLSISQFFGEWGIQVIKSEFFWIGIPCLTIMLIHTTIKKILG